MDILMAVLWGIINTLVVGYIIINVLFTIVGIYLIIRDGYDPDEVNTSIQLMWKKSDMNLFGKMLCTVLIFAGLPLFETVIGLINFTYWITHVRIGKEK